MHVILLVLFLSVPFFGGELRTGYAYKEWRSQSLDDEKGWRHNIYMMQSMDEKDFKMYCSGANFMNKDVGIAYYGLKNAKIHPSETGIRAIIKIKVDGKSQFTRTGRWLIDSEIADFGIGTFEATRKSQWISSMKKGERATVYVRVVDRFGNELRSNKFDMSLYGFTCVFNNEFKYPCTGRVGGRCPEETE